MEWGWDRGHGDLVGMGVMFIGMVGDGVHFSVPVQTSIM